jgi:hypothetical protein
MYPFRCLCDLYERLPVASHGAYPPFVKQKLRLDLSDG